MTLRCTQVEEVPPGSRKPFFMALQFIEIAAEARRRRSDFQARATGGVCAAPVVDAEKRGSVLSE
jgi:hypothetical protein